MTTLQDKLKKLPKKRQAKIQKRADELIVEERTPRIDAAAVAKQLSNPVSAVTTNN